MLKNVTVIQDSLKPNFQECGLKPEWTVFEAVCLSFGVDPNKAKPQRIRDAANLDIYDLRYINTYTTSYASASKYKKIEVEGFTERFEVLLRQNWSQAYKLSHNQPGYELSATLFIRWFDEKELDFPSELRELVIKNMPRIIITENSNASTTHSNEQKQKIEPEKPLHKPERDTMLKLIAGLLALNYNYTSIKNDITKATEISDDILRDAGIEINDDTIRKYLREAQTFLPDNLDEQN